MLLGIVLHSALPTVPNWRSGDAGDGILTGIFEWIHGFRMPLFFVISGYFEPARLASRTGRASRGTRSRSTRPRTWTRRRASFSTSGTCGSSGTWSGWWPASRPWGLLDHAAATPVFGPTVSDTIVPEAAVFLYYACFFAVGCLLQRRRGRRAAS